jgi:hypothetical protein
LCVITIVTAVDASGDKTPEQQGPLRMRLAELPRLELRVTRGEPPASAVIAEAADMCSRF